MDITYKRSFVCGRTKIDITAFLMLYWYNLEWEGVEMSENAKLQLIEFLSWAAEKGMMKKTTASAIKAACNAVLSVLDEGESADVTNINLETVFHRYENLHGFDVAPATMKAYRQRVSYAVEEFRKYNENKSGWKPSGGQRTNSSQPRSKKGSQNNVQTTETTETTESTTILTATLTRYQR